MSDTRSDSSFSASDHEAPARTYERVAVIIPCYNEAIAITKVVGDFRRELPGAQIWVYDNNSTDDTARLAHKAGAHVRHEQRRGKGNVVRSMMRDIDADCYVMVDGDDTYPAEAAPEMVRLVLDEGYDMVNGDRLSTTYFEENKSVLHDLGNRLVRGMINLLFSSNVRDIMTGYRAMGFGFTKTLPVLSRGFELETEMTIHALDKNMKLIEVPVAYRDRPEGSQSKINSVVDGAKVIGMIFNLVREYRPLMFFGVIGLLLMIIGSIFFGGVVAEFFQTGLVPRVPTLVVSMLLVVMGLLMISTGLILDGTAHKARKTFEIDLNELMWRRRLENDQGMASSDEKAIRA